MKNSREDKLKLHLRFYIAGRENNQVAINNLLRIRNDYIGEDSNIEIIDLLENPRVAIEDRIRALPQLVRISPEPILRLFGDLSDIQKTLHFLNIVDEENKINKNNR
jgi:circadian clock protein KaiB